MGSTLSTVIAPFWCNSTGCPRTSDAVGKTFIIPCPHHTLSMVMGARNNECLPYRVIQKGTMYLDKVVRAQICKKWA
jgi:hypothetical protein